jgi:hypothetical protein
LDGFASAAARVDGLVRSASVPRFFFPILISECGFGGIFTSCAMMRLATASSSGGWDMPNPWDIPPIADHGDIGEAVLFEQIGRALSEWEKVEDACAELFATFVYAPKQSTHRLPAIRAYGTVISYKNRCEMIKHAAEAYFKTRKAKEKQFSTELKKLLTTCQGFSGRRNEIAHGTVSVAFYSRRGKTKNIGHWLFPSLFNPNKMKIDTGVTYQYTSTEIIHFRQEFTKLHLKLTEFRERLTARLPKSSP